MIVCDYIDDNVKNYLNGRSNRIVITFFKEPFEDYNGNRVVFIDDILNEEDYRNIDEFTNRNIKITEDIFSIYLKIDKYYLFNYLKLRAKRNFGKIYKYKYAIDKIANIYNKTSIYFFCSEIELLEWVKKDYKVEDIPIYKTKSTNEYKSEYMGKIKKYLKNSIFANYIFDRIIMGLLKDRQDKYKKNILWMGGQRNMGSLLLNELGKKYHIFLMQNDLGKLRFMKRKYKFSLLKLKNNNEFKENWNQIKFKYRKGLNEISHETRINSNLLEVILKINRNIIKDLLITLQIFKDNSDNICLLFVTQSVIGNPALTVDYCNNNNIFSVELLHGVPCAIEVGKTSKLAVYGQRDKLFLSNHGVDESKIIITGCPYYDRIFNIKKEEKVYNFLLLILDWIVFTPSKNSQVKIFKQVIDMLKLLQHFKNENLIIKLHPGQSAKELNYICHLVNNFKEVKNRVKVIKERDTIDLLRNSKIVYNWSSSVGVEALLMKKPLIILDYIFNYRRSIDYEKYNGCMIAKSFKGLVISTEKILKDVHRYLRENNENIERTRRYFSGDLKGESYKNVARVINEMLYK